MVNRPKEVGLGGYGFHTHPKVILNLETVCPGALFSLGDLSAHYHNLIYFVVHNLANLNIV